MGPKVHVTGEIFTLELMGSILGFSVGNGLGFQYLNMVVTKVPSELQWKQPAKMVK